MASRTRVREAKYGEQSESKTLRDVLQVLHTVKTKLRTAVGDSPAVASMRSDVQYVTEELERLVEQVGRGLHTNPPLVVYGNPPARVRKRDLDRWQAGSLGRSMFGKFEFVGKIGDDVHEIRYTHAENGEDFKHGFAGSAEMFAIVRGDSHRDILITSATGKPLWGNF